MADTKTSTAPPPTRSHRVVKAFVALVLVAFLGALAWVTFLNWQKDGRFSFRIFDTAWWRPGVDSAQPVLDSAKAAGDKAGDALWGDSGLVDQSVRWWNGRLDERAKEQAAPTKPPAAAPASDTAKRCERAIADAEIDFQYGLDQYRLANPRAGDLEPQRREHLREARARFLSAKDLLGRALPTYEAAPDHDAERLKDGKALQLYNERLLASLDRELHLDRLQPAAP